MRFNYIKTEMPLIPVLGLMVFLVSCGSSEYASQNNDGIYGSSNSTVEYTDETNQTAGNNSSSYYQTLFKEKSMDYQMPTYEEGEVFTEVDDYEGNYVENDTINDEYYTNYAGWGQNSESVTVNVYNTGFNGWYSPYYYGGWGYSPYWNIGWGWGYLGSYWGYGWGGYYGGFYGGYYGWGYPSYYYPSYYSPYYRNRSYSRRGYAYNNAGSRYYSNRYSQAPRRNGNQVRSTRSTTVRNSSSVNATRSSSYTRSNTVRNSTGTRATRSNSTVRSNNNTTRSRSSISSPSRSSRSYSSPSSSSRSSSGSMRSSGGSMRSSGGSRSSGGGRR